MARSDTGIVFIAEKASDTPCSICNGEVVEYSIPNHIWNMIVRNGGKEHDREYLCIWCFVKSAIVWLDVRLGDGPF